MHCSWDGHFSILINAAMYELVLLNHIWYFFISLGKSVFHIALPIWCSTFAGGSFLFQQNILYCLSNSIVIYS